MPSKRDSRAARRSNVDAAVSFTISGCFTGAEGVAAATVCTGVTFFHVGRRGSQLGNGVGIDHGGSDGVVLGLSTRQEA